MKEARWMTMKDANMEQVSKHLRDQSYMNWILFVMFDIQCYALICEKQCLTLQSIRELWLYLACHSIKCFYMEHEGVLFNPKQIDWTSRLVSHVYCETVYTSWQARRRVGAGCGAAAGCVTRARARCGQERATQPWQCHRALLSCQTSSVKA